MSQFDYGKMQGTASRLMARFKQGVVVYTEPGTQSGPAYNPVITPGASHTLEATVSGVSEEYIDGTHVVSTDKMVTAGVFGAVPVNAGTLSVDGQKLQIIEVMPVPAAGTTLVWKMIVRA